MLRRISQHTAAPRTFGRVHLWPLVIPIAIAGSSSFVWSQAPTRDDRRTISLADRLELPRMVDLAAAELSVPIVYSQNVFGSQNRAAPTFRLPGPITERELWVLLHQALAARTEAQRARRRHRRRRLRQHARGRRRPLSARPARPGQRGIVHCPRTNGGQWTIPSRLAVLTPGIFGNQKKQRSCSSSGSQISRGDCPQGQGGQSPPPRFQFS